MTASCPSSSSWNLRPISPSQTNKSYFILNSWTAITSFNWNTSGCLLLLLNKAFLAFHRLRACNWINLIRALSSTRSNNHVRLNSSVSLTAMEHLNSSLSLPAIILAWLKTLLFSLRIKWVWTRALKCPWRWSMWIKTSTGKKFESQNNYTRQTI